VQLRQALNSAIARLTAQHVLSPRMNAELLIMFTLDCDRAYLYAHPERELTAEEISRYDDALARRATGVPAQYITGHQEFWGMDLIVSPAVLIPRPETEHVVETVLALVTADGSRQKQDQDQRPRAPSSGAQGRSAPHNLCIADVGTGSGAIALALARELPSAEIHATDISAEALEVAQANAARHELSSCIRFHRADLLSGVDPAGASSAEVSLAGRPVVAQSTELPLAEFDFIVSNPPYVGESEEDHVQLEVRKFEPRSAVFAGPTGLEVIERLIPQAREALRPGGWLVFEISGTIAEGVRRLLADWDEVAISNDLQGIARVARARRPTGG
jgi:release factor glutamine methyltransferase